MKLAATGASGLIGSALVPAPAFALRLALGEMADATLLASARVRPVRLDESRCTFRLPALEGALRHLLGRPSKTG